MAGFRVGAVSGRHSSVVSAFSPYRVLALWTVVALSSCRGSAPIAEGPSVPATQPAPAGHAEAAAAAPGADLSELDSRPLYTFTETELDAYLRHLRQREPDLLRRVIHLGLKNIGQPYQIYLLGEYPYELYDPDPLYCLSKSDCVTFAEHTYAMALAHDWPSFFNILQRLRYKDGTIGMLTRNHYTIADWDRNNGFLFEDMTQKLGGGRASVPLREMVKRARFFAKFGIGQDIPDEEVNDAYIPTENVPPILAELRAGDFVNIIRGDASSQWAGHVGLIALTDDGSVNFLHSSEPAVREQPLMEYLRKNKKCLGMKVLRLRENAQEIIDAELSRSGLRPRTFSGDGRTGFQPVTFNRDSERSAGVRHEGTSTTSTNVERPLVSMLQPDGSIPAAGDPPQPPAASQPASQPSTQRATTMMDYRLEFDTPVDPQVQSALESIDCKLGQQFGIPDADRACGVLDLTDLKLAMVRPDAMFYGASVPKIGILLAYFETHPETAAGLAPPVERELQLMIKRSDNDLAARYSQIVGLETIQRVLQSDKYRLYTREHGGLWCGKHYGIDQPRMGDPVHDHSHAATVRQCLRYYLMLEQGRLVSPAASQKMKAIFAAPLLDFHNDNFVKGLNGRDVTLIRKSGEWEDWHLDTARVQHGDRAYLIAAMAHHPKGADYLAALAAAVDDALCGLQPRKSFAHENLAYQAPGPFSAVSSEPTGAPDTFEVRLGSYTSPIIESRRPFNEVLPSWNIETTPNLGFVVELRVGRRFDESWSPWLLAGHCDLPDRDPNLVTRYEHGEMEVDYFRSAERFDCVQYRIHAAQPASASNQGGSILLPPNNVGNPLNRFTLCLSDRTGIPLATHDTEPSRQSIAPDRWQRRLSVPHFSQATERPEMKSQICSPASVAMVLAYRGVKATPEDVAVRAFDPNHNIYGNWPYNVQAAYTYGVPGYVTRFSDWHEVEHMIADDQPLVISIRYGEGEMPAAPMKSTDGHLVVLVGFDAEGNALINDPATSDPQRGQYACRREHLEKAWTRQGGTAYVLLPPAEPRSSLQTTP